MRVQYQDQHLRVRMDEAELARLLAGDTVQNRTVASVWTSRQAVLLTESGQPSLGGRADDWQLALPAADVRALACRLPSRDGLDYALPVGGSLPLRVLFDVDVRDSRRQRSGG